MKRTSRMSQNYVQDPDKDARVLKIIEQAESPLSFEEVVEDSDVESEEEVQRSLMRLVDGNKIALTADWNYKEIRSNHKVTP